MEANAGRNRIVVPELRASSGGQGAQTAQAAALDFDRQPAFGGSAAITPAPARQSGMAAQSAPCELCPIVDGPIASAASGA
jgi:hypothetical protein